MKPTGLGIDFKLPTGIPEGALNAGSERGLELALHPLTAGVHERFEAGLALLIAGSSVGGCIAAEA